mmetsp:Transcript_1223/g.3243  ORF Transcript_1223/g.3243 Transcript_1223/m.3243 type:complete len:157 (-) Transcript_1223:168-638(-)|eukprot:CAMPEP_0119123700 /NCGR_PEP_ID=MMETSP1310-20130426/3565_1 /TAXON_ID=464262 /ORGANISM="Genus nov. species nov., Strain RCC2339" /LENGTH=156 /DNA_ID=CAMNT_0007113557 /DNA_START=251 /DNA_END=721 /DNA_ORIENTATION=-
MKGAESKKGEKKGEKGERKGEKGDNKGEKSRPGLEQTGRSRTEPRTREKRAKMKRFSLGEDALRHILYGFGDEKIARADTVALMDELAVCYVRATTAQASTWCRDTKLGAREVLTVLRDDEKKYHRGAELIRMHEELKRVRQLPAELESIATTAEP